MQEMDAGNDKNRRENHCETEGYIVGLEKDLTQTHYGLRIIRDLMDTDDD